MVNYSENWDGLIFVLIFSGQCLEFSRTKSCPDFFRTESWKFQDIYLTNNVLQWGSLFLLARCIKICFLKSTGTEEYIKISWTRLEGFWVNLVTANVYGIAKMWVMSHGNQVVPNTLRTSIAFSTSMNLLQQSTLLACEFNIKRRPRSYFFIDFENIHVHSYQNVSTWLAWNYSWVF